MEALSEKRKQPRVLYLSFITAMCERFGYYIIGFLLTLYLKAIYNFSDAQAFTVFALFTALGYLTPAIGGYLADHYIGIKRCLGLGLIFEAIGYGLIALPTQDVTIFRFGLSFIIIGAGIFKTAPTNILGRSYAKDDPRIDSGFTLYYMGINIGSFVASLASGSIQKAMGWHAPFAFASGGLILGVIWFFIFKHHAKDFESEAGKKTFHLGKWLITIVASLAIVVGLSYLLKYPTIANYAFYVGSVAILLVIAYETFKCPRDEKMRVLVCLALIFMAVIFFILYFQLYTSMELFIERNVDRNFFGFEIPTVYFLGLNGFWIIVLSPLFAKFYHFLQKRDKDLAITTKFPLGILLIGFCFLTLRLACTFFATDDFSVSSIWVVFALFLYSAGELLTSALGVAMITRIAPKRMYGIMMGAWYLIATALAAELSGVIAGFASVPEKFQTNASYTLPIYTHAFDLMWMIGLAAAVIGFFLSPFLKRVAGLGEE